MPMPCRTRASPLRFALHSPRYRALFWRVVAPLSGNSGSCAARSGRRDRGPSQPSPRGCYAATLTPVAAPAGSGIPWWVGFAVAGVILVAGFIWLKVKKPATAAVVQTTVSADVAALISRIDLMLHHVAPASATLEVSSTEPTPAIPAPAGKQGVAGVFTATVTGDPKVDLPALTAAYLG